MNGPLVISKGSRCMQMQDVFVHGPRQMSAQVRNLGRDVPGAIHLANAYCYDSVEAARAAFACHTNHTFNRIARPDVCTPYVRFGNPNTAELEGKIQYAHGLTCENNYETLVYGSGMGAIFAALIATTRPGDEIIFDKKSHLYGCSGRLSNILEKVFNRKAVWIDIQDTDEGYEQLREAIKDNTTAIYFENESNPFLKLNNIGKIAQLAHLVNVAQNRKGQKKITLISDNTFLGPLFCRPWEIVRDAVPDDPELLVIVESLTKIISGFGLDAGGAVVAPQSIIHDANWEDEGLIALRDVVGSILSPFHAFEISNRSMPTYIDRAKTAEQVAKRFAEFLETVKGRWVSSVTYPGLPSFPQNELAASMITDYDGVPSTGFMLGFTFAGTLEEQEAIAVRYMDFIAQQGYIWTFMVSLGQVRSLTEVPAAMTHYGSGIPMFARNSLGTESPDSVIEEATAAFKYAYGDQ